MAKDSTMFNNAFTKSTDFLSLPIPSKLLYFYLLEDADTDGIIDAASTLRIAKSEIADWTNLINKNFIWLLQKPYIGFIPDYITHNPNLDRRWLKDSKYLPLLAEKYPDALIQRRLKDPLGKIQKRILTVTQYMKIQKADQSPLIENTQEVLDSHEIPRVLSSSHEIPRVLSSSHENSREIELNINQENTIEEKAIEGKVTEKKVTEAQQHKNHLIELGVALKKADELSTLPQVQALSKDQIHQFWKYAQSKATKNPLGYFICILENTQSTHTASLDRKYDANCSKCHGTGKYTLDASDVSGNSEKVQLPCDCILKER